ncbi:MAG: FAD-dependent monooxygenase [Cyanobacteria bacterium TGS_CYA1]|nr:FAD-dependent monooxygenase [Cyanobacteria bacterium TGS_CYA1]
MGAGIGGLAAAISLRKVGYLVDIFEKSPNLQEVGAGIVLYPNAVNALKQMGVYVQISQIASFPTVARYLNSKGKVLVEMNMNDFEPGSEAITIHRLNLQKVLCDAALSLGAQIHFNKECWTLEQDTDTVTLHFSDDTKTQTDIVIGADGIHSKIRKNLINDGEPRYTGSFAWRGVTSSQVSYPSNQSLLIFGRGKQFGATPVGSGRVYWFATMSDEKGHQDRRTKQDVLKFFGDWTDPVNELIDATKDSEILTHNLYDRDPVLKWGEGRVTILGDAAHPMTPFMGQGGCQSLEDAIALGHCMKVNQNPVEALRQYEKLRQERTSDFVYQSRKSEAMSMTTSRISTMLRDAILPMVPSKLIAKQLHTLANYKMPEL